MGVAAFRAHGTHKMLLLNSWFPLKKPSTKKGVGPKLLNGVPLGSKETSKKTHPYFCSETRFVESGFENMAKAFCCKIIPKSKSLEHLDPVR